MSLSVYKPCWYAEALFGAIRVTMRTVSSIRMIKLPIRTKSCRSSLHTSMSVGVVGRRGHGVRRISLFYRSQEQRNMALVPESFVLLIWRTVCDPAGLAARRKNK